jgi:hypothetical protein
MCAFYAHANGAVNAALDALARALRGGGCSCAVATSFRRADAAALGVNLIWFGFGELGLGEDLRVAAQACDASGVPFKVLNIDPGKHLRQADRLLAPHCTDDVAELPYAINLFCLTAADTQRVHAERGVALFDGRHNIGWWAWELPVWPQRWPGAFALDMIL